MNLIALIIYGIINLAMVLCHIKGPGRCYHFPFWAGIIGLGWFFPQAFGSLNQKTNLPEGSYAAGLLFASLCTLALWWGFTYAVNKFPEKPSWLDAYFDASKLFYAGAFLCVFGFFFQWKLMNLPVEVLASTQWSGAAVKYVFLANVFKLGLITLWLLFLTKDKWLLPSFLIFLIPSFLTMFKAAFLHGRRAEMMELFSYVFVSLWFVRKKTLPRWLLISGLSVGLLLVNAIGMYRGIMHNRDKGLKERFVEASKADYLGEAGNVSVQNNMEFRNYVTYRQVYDDEMIYDYGIVHWNLFIFNYVPGQIVGRDLKASLMLPLKNFAVIAQEKYNHVTATGSTVSGYLDAYGSFGWLGFMKFALVGIIMGVLYRHAMSGSFLGQLLYIYGLGTAMHVVTHQTNDILVRIWVYFFVLAYPLFYLAKIRVGHEYTDHAAVNRTS